LLVVGSWHPAALAAFFIAGWFAEYLFVRI
jgi:hypothetical protein